MWSCNWEPAENLNAEAIRYIQTTVYVYFMVDSMTVAATFKVGQIIMNKNLTQCHFGLVASFPS